MAGSANSEDNPVAINVTAMVDIIFCLCVFFMCSLHFRQAEGLFKTWLPRDKGVDGPGATTPLTEMRVAMSWDDSTRQTIRQFGQRVIQSDDELESVIGEARADLVRLEQSDAPLTIDADARVPWDDVIDVVNMGKRQDVERIEFAMGAAPPK